MKSVTFSTPAGLELNETIAHYDSRHAGLGFAFLVEVHEILTRIAESPAQFPVWDLEPTFRKVERAEAMTFDALAVRVVTKTDLIAMKRRAAADPARPRSKSLRDQADIALLEGDVPLPDEGW